MSKAVVLMYHNIGMPPKTAKKRGLYVTPRMFGFQMWYLKAAGFRVVPLVDFTDFISGDKDEGRLAALTFDDGYEDFYDNAYPVLRKYNYPSTLFVVSDLAGKENSWDRDRREVRKGLLDWKKLAELNRSGVHMGAHTRTHASLARISGDRLREEIAGSKKVIEDKLGCPVESFCYPYGDYNGETVEVVREAGFVTAVTTKRGYVRKGDNPFEMNRISIKFGTHPLSFLYKLHVSCEVRGGLL
jgi:peptidoglycan/xylan/chitin deacetylase (PgdA/CDA1 family)